LELIAKETAGKDITFVQEMTESEGVIWSDPYQIRQVIINLLANGVHAIRKTGTVTVDLSEERESITLTVSDSGEGIPNENIDKIFEPFFTTKPPDKGTGLGLYVSREIVKRLGGSINVQSAPGKGACFMLTLPKRRSNSTEYEDKADVCHDILKKIKEMNHNGPNPGKNTAC